MCADDSGWNRVRRQVIKEEKLRALAEEWIERKRSDRSFVTVLATVPAIVVWFSLFHTYF